MRVVINILAVIGAAALVLMVALLVWFWSVSTPSAGPSPGPSSSGETATADGQTFRDVTVEATVPFSRVQQEVGRGLVFRDAGGGKLHVTVPVDVFGRSITATSVATVNTDGRNIVVSPETVDVPGPGFVDGAATEVAKRLITVREPAPGLPEGMQLQNVTTVPDGFRVSLDAQQLRLDQQLGQ